MGSSSADDQSEWSQDVLLTEYEEAGEEFRYRDRLLHNTYYLLITGAVLLTGSISQAWMAGELQFAAIQIILGGFALLFVGTLILNHFVQRKSANALRFRAAAHVEGAYEETPERPLSIPYWVVAKNCKFDEDDGIVETGSPFRELWRCPDSLYSAKIVSLICFLAGFVTILGGFMLLFPIAA